MSRRRKDIGVAAAIVAILPAAVLVLWLLGWYADLGGSPAEGNTRGEIAGTVWTVDRDTSMIHVSVKPFGLGALPYAVTGDTRVLIGDKEGVLEDLREGMYVTVAYERREDHRVASLVEYPAGHRR